MMQLILVRHAKTEPGRSGQDDWHRELEARGRRDAREMGARLLERGLKPDLILASPAVRALKTAQIFGTEAGIPISGIVEDERLYLASPKAMLEVVHERGGDAAQLMIVGHNPGITEFADRLSAERSLDNMPTCAVYTLEFDIADWTALEWDTGVNAEFVYRGSPER